MKQFVISGINLFEGGPLSIFYDCLDTIVKEGIYQYFDVVAFVHKKELFSKYANKLTLIELPKSRKSYIYRLYYEYLAFYRYSCKHDIEVWLSLHDMTPRVKAKRLFTYCHNVSPFIDKNIKNIRYCITNVVFSYLYKYIYRINIKSADAIIVQTKWMRDAFLDMYALKSVIVARPEQKMPLVCKQQSIRQAKAKRVFIYPVFPRYFKNIEVVCEAAKHLNANKCEIILTLDGSENNYARYIYNKYKNVDSITWTGILPRDKIYELYETADCLIFSSTMETWGLPISEFKNTGKDIILVDLPYARETLDKYDRVIFFDKNDSVQLRNAIEMVIANRQKYQPTECIMVDPPFVIGWKELLELLLA